MHKANTMRIATGLMLISLLLPLLVACGGSGEAATATPVPAEPTEAPAAAPTEAPALEPTQVEAAPTEPPAAASACPAGTLADPQGVPSGEWPQQYELAEYESLAGCDMTFSGRSEFHKDLWTYGHADGDLPPVEERLPEEPLVVEPYDAIGHYGGRARWISLGPESGNSEFLSVRHVNLVRFLDDGKTIVPNVAKSFQWNDDFTAITFELRKGHKWSDGHPFTVDDILFWWEDIMLNPDLYPETESYWVYGGEPMQIEKIDDQKFTIHFAAPASGFLTMMARTWIQPWQPKHFLEDMHVKYNPDAAAVAEAEGYADWAEYFFSWFGNWQDAVHRYGVPKLESHILVEETTEYKVFAANPYYFKVDTAGNQLPYIDEIYQSYAPDKELIELKIINGEVDQKAQTLQIASLPLYKQHEEDGNYSIQMPPGAENGRIYTFNCTSEDPVLREIFQEPNFSHAMSVALNRDEINQTLCFGLCEPEQGVPVHPTASFAKDEWYTYATEYDPDTANALLDEIGLTERDGDGFRLRPDGKTLTVFMVYPQQAGNPALHELAKEYWEDVGVKVELKEVSSEAYRTMAANNEHDIAVMNSGATLEPFLHSTTYRLVPPFGDAALEPLCGGPWAEWWSSDGAAGEEPPEDVKDLFDLTSQWKSSLPGTEEYTSLIQDIIGIHREHFWLIGTISSAPALTIVHNRLKNVPEWKVQAWDYYRTYLVRPDQWYIED
jgi:peptide/nickel transport system substrate-binding protein